jgi:hypothetical protein
LEPLPPAHLLLAAITHLRGLIDNERLPSMACAAWLGICSAALRQHPDWSLMFIAVGIEAVGDHGYDRLDEGDKVRLRTLAIEFHKTTLGFKADGLTKLARLILEHMNDESLWMDAKTREAFCDTLERINKKIETTLTLAARIAPTPSASAKPSAPSPGDFNRRMLEKIKSQIG